MGKVRPRSGWLRSGWLRSGWLRSGWPAEQNGWAGIRGRPPGRAVPGSRLADGAWASASAVKTRIRPARGGGRGPRWPRARGQRRAGDWRRARDWRRAEDWRARPGAGRWGLVWRQLRPRRPGWSHSRGWPWVVPAMCAGTIPREAPHQARNCRQRLTRRRPGCPQRSAGLACLARAPRNRRAAAGAGPEPSGPAARTRRAPDFPDHSTGTGLYAADLPVARNHYHGSHSTGYFLYSPQTPVQAHFRQSAILCRSSYFLVHTGWPAV